jgi:hypothetical protein
MKKTNTKIKSELSVDLSKRPPRSPRARLGGFVWLPRLIDKARASASGTLGEYHFEKGLDVHFFKFVGIAPDAFKKQAAKTPGDGEVLAWVQANAKHKREPWEVAAWSHYHENRVPDSDAETVDFFAGLVRKLSITREDVRTYYEYLDLDDYCSFGGKA